MKEYQDISQRYRTLEGKKQSIQRMVDDLKKQASTVKDDISSKVNVLEKRLSLLAKAKSQVSLRRQ